MNCDTTLMHRPNSSIYSYRIELIKPIRMPQWTRSNVAQTSSNDDLSSDFSELGQPDNSASSLLLLARYTKPTKGTNSFRPFSTTPLEVIERILDYLPLLDLIRMRRLDRSFNTLLQSPHLYHTISIPASPAPHPELLCLLPSLLPGTVHLSLRSFPLHALVPLLDHVTPGRLAHLDLSFSAVRDDQLAELAHEGVLRHVRSLKLKGCRGVSDGRWLANMLPVVEQVDLSWSGLNSLPIPRKFGTEEELDSANQTPEEVYSISPASDDSGYFSDLEMSAFVPSCRSIAWPRLRHLNLSSCPHLSISTLENLLGSLPSGLRSLNMSHLPLDTTCLTLFSPPETLAAIDLTGIDALTLSSIRHLDRLWNGRVKILHSAVLESDHEDDVKRFVELVAGVYARTSSGDM